MASIRGARDLQDWPEDPDVEALAQLVDVHAHPTDYKAFPADKVYRDSAAGLHLHKLCAMSSHLGDQDLVRQLAEEQPEKILPAFGLHPWWSHHISFSNPSESLDKVAHYASLFPEWFSATELSEDATSLLSSFPEPKLFATYATDILRPYLQAHPSAMLGEVGLDRSFRIPYPQTDAKSNREDHKISKKFTELKTPVEHQVRLLREQLEIAFELGRNISMHSVQAQGATVELLSSLQKSSTHWSSSQSKICLHSYGGSAETISRIHRIHPDRVYFSFSTTINARLDRLEELIQAVPDDRLLIESDYNDVRKSEMRIWEILGVLCEAKKWSKEKAVEVLNANWVRFSGVS